MERVAVERLPELDAFRAQWRGLLAELIARGRNRGWDCHEDRRLREVVAKMEGAEGLARIARTTKGFEDLRAWFRVHAEAHDWNVALAAYDEAAELVTDSADVRGEFLDGAARSA